MKILSIETSCDDTGISIMEVKGGITNASFEVLANNVSSQISIHIPYGGVFPALAKREHIKNLPIILEKTLKESKIKNKKKPVDLITVTYGPGLEPTLWTGITFAQELAKKWNVPIMPVNHMEGHMLSIFANKKKKFKVLKIKNPALALLVSGGHTELVLIKKWMNYEIIGQTLDDAVGEAFDKVARMLDLPYPGGPEISKLAEQERNKTKNENIKLPRPMLYSKNLDFSFSGLKTAVLYLIKKIEPINKKTKAQIALEFENAAIECLVHKTAKAIEKYKIKTLIVAGGVSANEHLRNKMKEITGKKIKLFLPSKELTGDNSLMIGIAGYLNYIKNKKETPKIDSIKANGNLRL
ncbi:MAG: tRNA (adenosine(37)-N6)-threonylcarbamoyltransferase complex transferase subunit TsaD [Candidatus Paceibacterota bacterium]